MGDTFDEGLELGLFIFGDDGLLLGDFLDQFINISSW